MGRIDNKNKAKSHTALVRENFSADVRYSVINTYFFDDELVKNVEFTRLNEEKSKIEVVDMDSVSAIYESMNDDISMVLNFADYSSAGGMFLDGAYAQEEALCHESMLFNVLKSFDKDFYGVNRKTKNRGLYLNRALYSEDVVFMRKGHYVSCDVLTCACPNKNGLKYGAFTEEENSRVLKDRIEFVMKVAYEKLADNLILGAYGCGVFHQNPYEVASIFKEFLDKNPYLFKKVIFAIPNSHTNINYKVFKEVFK